MSAKGSVKKNRNFTIFHGLVVSIVIHGVLGLPFIARVIAAPPEDPPLFIELEGVAPDSPDLAELQQSDVNQTMGDPQDSKPAAPEEDMIPREAPPPDEPPMEVAASEEATYDPPQPTPVPPMKAVETPAPEMKAAPDDNTVKGANQYVPPTRKLAQPEISDEAYSVLLMKKVRNNLVYPDEAKRARLQGVATVSFVILDNGEVRPDTLKIVKSSGRPALDASALNTIRASTPFAPPPREMAVSIGVAFGPKR